MPEYGDESDGQRGRRRKPDPTATAYARYRRADPPGPWTADRANQVRHYKGVVYLAIRARMDAIASSTVQVVERRKRPKKSTLNKALPTAHAQSLDEEFAPARPGEGNPVADLIHEPNKRDTINEVLAKLLLQYDLTGGLHLWGNPNPLGAPAELWPLKSAQLHVQTSDPHQYPAGLYRLNPYLGGAYYGPHLPTNVLIDGRDIHRLFNHHPFLDYDGYAPTTAADVQLDVLDKIDKSRWSGANRSVRPDGVLNVPGADKDQVQAIRSSIEEQFAGEHRQGGIFVVGGPPEGGGIDFKAWAVTQRDLENKEGWEQMVGFCLAMYGVPKSIACLAEAGSYAKFFAELKAYQTLTLRPLAKRLSDWLTRVLCRPWGRKDDRVQIDLPAIDDPELLDRRLGPDTNRITVNEARQLRGMKPVEGGDVPETIYLAVLQQKHMPRPDPAQMGAVTEPGKPPGKFGGMAGESGPPQPANPDGKGSLPGKPGVVAKAAGNVLASILESLPGWEG